MDIRSNLNSRDNTERIITAETQDPEQGGAHHYDWKTALQEVGSRLEIGFSYVLRAQLC